VQPSVGRIVHYRLNAFEADQVNTRRNDAQAHATGHVLHTGNRASEGDVCAAVVVRVFGDSSGSPANLQVLLDGNDALWATSRCEGEGPGTWSWPPRI
jgi:hypothetical protein